MGLLASRLLATNHAPSQGDQPLSVLLCCSQLCLFWRLTSVAPVSPHWPQQMCPLSTPTGAATSTDPHVPPALPSGAVGRDWFPRKGTRTYPQSQSQQGAERPHAGPPRTGSKHAPAPLLPNPPSFPCLCTPRRRAALPREQHAAGLSASLRSFLVSPSLTEQRFV